MSTSTTTSIPRWQKRRGDESSELVERMAEQLIAVRDHRADCGAPSPVAGPGSVRDRRGPARADAVVVGSGPGGSLGRFAMGSTTNQLLHHCTTPPLLVPAGYVRHPVDRVRRVMVAFAQGKRARWPWRGVDLARAGQMPDESHDDPRASSHVRFPSLVRTPKAACSQVRWRCCAAINKRRSTGLDTSGVEIPPTCWW